MQVETDAAAISAYIIFLSKYGLPTAEEIKVKERHELEELAMVNIIDIKWKHDLVIYSFGQCYVPINIIL